MPFGSTIVSRIWHAHFDIFRFCFRTEIVAANNPQFLMERRNSDRLFCIVVDNLVDGEQIGHKMNLWWAAMGRRACWLEALYLWIQCDQMVTKLVQFPKTCHKCKTVLTLKVILFKKSQQFSRYLDYFCNKICCQELLKIAKSDRGALAEEKESEKESNKTSFQKVSSWFTQLANSCSRD